MLFDLKIPFPVCTAANIPPHREYCYEEAPATTGTIASSENSDSSRPTSSPDSEDASRRYSRSVVISTVLFSFAGFCLFIGAVKFCILAVFTAAYRSVRMRYAQSGFIVSQFSVKIKRIFSTAATAASPVFAVTASRFSSLF